MRRLILAAAGLALLVPAALAQTPGGAGPQGMPGMAPAPQGMQGMPGLMPPPPPHGPHGGPGMMPPPPPSRAAHFHFERGDAVIDVKCADEDTTKACADIVGGLLDKLAALPAPQAAKP